MKELDGGQLDMPEISRMKAVLQICDDNDLGRDSVKYAPLSMIETLQDAAYQQMQAEVSQMTASSQLPEAQEQALDEYPMPDEQAVSYTHLLGRNHIETGTYMEIFFPEHGVRYIAINDGYDSNEQSQMDIAPFRNIINEMYAKDTSRKIKSALRTRKKSGKYISSAIVFVLAAFVPKDFLAVAFDSGGVTTGPMTVPFIMALGVGISAIRSDRHAADDSFGLVALCSIGPILAVLILGIAYSPGESSYTAAFLPDIQDSVELWDLFMVGLPAYFKEIALSLLPIMVFFGVYQFAVLHMSRKALGKILVGLFYTYIGLVLFLTGANVGFMPAGNYLGQVLAALPYRWVLIPLGMLIGYFIVKAEPAVYVLNKQVEEVTDGSISAKAMGTSLSIGVALSVGLAMLRVLTGISILWMLVPGYGIAIGLSFFVPKIFTAIAFDSGGVASGPMTATFLLPLAQGACLAVGGNIVTDAFGVVAMVAMTPLITIQILGMTYQLKQRHASRTQQAYVDAFASLPEDAIIEL